MTDFKNGVCKFVGDWKSLKHKGFSYTNYGRILYVYQGLHGEYKYSSTVIRKEWSIVQVSDLTGCLLQVFEFITQSCSGIIPDKLYIDRVADTITTTGETCPYHLNGRGIDVLYRMYLDGDIIHAPHLSVY